MIADGLAAKVAKFDSGGYLQPGYTLAYNGTGQPERIRTAAQEGGQLVSGTARLLGTNLEVFVEGVLVNSTAAAARAF